MSELRRAGCDSHVANDPEFTLFPPHALPGQGREIVARLDTTDAAAIIHKRRYSAFFGTDLDEQLRALGVPIPADWPPDTAGSSTSSLRGSSGVAGSRCRVFGAKEDVHELLKAAVRRE